MTFNGTAQEANAVLERLGSEYRAIPNTPVGPAIIAILDALPSYIDKMVEQKIEALADRTKKQEAI